MTILSLHNTHARRWISARVQGVGLGKKTAPAEDKGGSKDRK